MHHVALVRFGKLFAYVDLLHKMQLVANWNSSRLHLCNHSKGTQSKYFVHVCFLHCIACHKGSREGLIESRGDDEKSQFSRRRFRENGFFCKPCLHWTVQWKWERRKKPCKVHLMPPFSIERGQDTKFEISLVSPARNVPVAFCTWCRAPNAATGFDAPRAAIEFLWSTFCRVKVCIWISWNREAKRKKNSAIFQFSFIAHFGCSVFLLHSSMPYLTFSCLRKVI